VVGTAGNDTIIGDSTYGNPADQIDGGAGVDTLKLSNFGQGNLTVLPQIKNVEKLSLVGFNAGAALDVSAVTGLTNVTIENNPLQNVQINGLTSAISLGLTNVSDNAITIGGKLGATDAAATLVVTGSKDAGAVTFDGAKIETVTVNSTGAVANKLADLKVATGALKNLVITGDQGLTVTANLANTVAKIDASASTGATTLKTAATLVGDLTVTGGAGADTLTVGAGATKVVKVALGAGNDKLTLGDLSTYAATSTFDGGAGTDTIVIVDGSKLTATTGKQITGFETLDLAGGKGVYDVSLLAAGNTISTIQVGAALADVATVKNVATGSAINILANDAKDLTVEVKDALTTKTDSLSFNLGGAAAVVSTKLTALEVETITLNSTTKLATWNNATDKNVVTSLVADKATTLTITGDKSLELTGATAAALTKIDASAFTGNFVMGAATAATSILGGTGNDTLLASATGSTINAGKGNDAITLNAALVKDVVILNAGDATAVVSSGAMDFAKLESITGFKTGTDVIDLGSFGFTAQQKSALAMKGTITAASVGADVANFFVDTGVARGVAVATDGTDQYLFVDVNKDGNFNVVGDVVIKLVGADIANFADIGF